MKKVKRLIELVKIDPYIVISYMKLCVFNFYFLIRYIPDDIYLKTKFYYRLHRKLDIKNPVSMNEKIQWLKINDRNPIYTQLVDKYSVREYVKKKIGKEYLVPIIGIWNKVENIDFSELPKKFVLKTTHDSGGVIICKDKSNLDLDLVNKKLTSRLQKNWFYHTREWPYKNVKPRILAEEFIETETGDVPEDYKIICLNGKVENIMVCIGREKGKPKFYYFDKEWNLLRLNKVDKELSQNFTLPKPIKLNEMIEVAEKLTENINFCRVDLYCINTKVLFGELTFYPDSGFDIDITEETDYMLGKKIELIGYSSNKILKREG